VAVGADHPYILGSFSSSDIWLLRNLCFQFRVFRHHPLFQTLYIHAAVLLTLSKKEKEKPGLTNLNVVRAVFTNALFSDGASAMQGETFYVCCSTCSESKQAGRHADDRCNRMRTYLSRTRHALHASQVTLPKVDRYTHVWSNTCVESNAQRLVVWHVALKSDNALFMGLL